MGRFRSLAFLAAVLAATISCDQPSDVAGRPGAGQAGGPHAADVPHSLPTASLPPPLPPGDPVGRLKPMTPQQIRTAAMGCLQSPPFMPDTGPTCIRLDGSWASYSGWGSGGGCYALVGHRLYLIVPRNGAEVRSPVKLIDRALSSSFSRRENPASYLFYRDGTNRMFVRARVPWDGEMGSPRLLEPYPEASYLGHAVPGNAGCTRS